VSNTVRYLGGQILIYGDGHEVTVPFPPLQRSPQDVGNTYSFAMYFDTVLVSHAIAKNNHGELISFSELFFCPMLDVRPGI
jgi:hypothetical protein